MAEALCQKNEQYSQDKINKLIGDYHMALDKGDTQALKETTAKIVKFIERYVYKTLWETCSAVMQNPMYCEDLKQEVWVHILKELKNYDPEKGALTTFVKYWIRHVVAKFFSKNFHNTSTYYAAAIQKITIAKNYCRQAGLDANDIDILVRQTGLAETTIKHALAQMEQQNKTSYEALVDTGLDCAADFQSPESSLMEAEFTQEFMDICEEILTKDEWEFFFLLVNPGENGKTHASYREMQSYYPGSNIPKIKKRASRILTKLYSSDRISKLIPQLKRNEKALEDIFIPVFDSDDEDEVNDMYSNFIRDMDIPERDDPQVKKIQTKLDRAAND